MCPDLRIRTFRGVPTPDRSTHHGQHANPRHRPRPDHRPGRAHVAPGPSRRPGPPPAAPLAGPRPLTPLLRDLPVERGGRGAMIDPVSTTWSTPRLVGRPVELSALVGAWDRATDGEA